MSLYKQLSMFSEGDRKYMQHGNMPEKERLKIQWRIKEHFRNKPNSTLKYYHLQHRRTRLEIKYMYGGMYHIARATKQGRQPLNIWGSIKEIIDIIENEKYK